jgi:hypothetical protein
MTAPSRAAIRVLALPATGRQAAVILGVTR